MERGRDVLLGGAVVAADVEDRRERAVVRGGVKRYPGVSPSSTVAGGTKSASAARMARTLAA
jgi:hypothetical protein